MTITPNPVDRAAAIQCPLAVRQLSVHRANGSLAGLIPLSASGRAAWETSGLENGVYVLKAVEGSQTYTMKIVVRR
jgi:hypothetical protein